MKKIVSIIFVGFIGLQAQEPIQQRLIPFLNRFMTLLQTHSMQEAQKSIVPLVHPTLLDKSGALDGDTRQFSFKKAYFNAKKYANPVRITRIQKLNTTFVGTPKRPYYGVEYKVWIAKKEGQNGMPAPIVLQERSKDKRLFITYMGSL